MLILPLVMLLLAANQYIAQNRDDETDAWLFRYYGRQMVEGRRLYVDLWDNKPPGIYWLNYALAQFGSSSRWAEYAVCGLATLLACGGLARLAWRITGQWIAGTLAALLSAVFVLHPYFLVGGNRAQTFVVALEIGAALLYWNTVSLPGRRRLRLLACGVLCGTAITFLQTAVELPMAIVFIEIARAIHLMKKPDASVCHGFPTGEKNPDRQRPAVVALSGIFDLGAGMFLTLGLAILALAVNSGLSAAYDAIIAFPLSCIQPGRGSGWRISTELIMDAVAVCWMPAIVAVAGMAAWATVGFEAAAGAEASETGPANAVPTPDPLIHQLNHALLFLIAWFLAAFGIALLIPSRQWHYFAPSLPPLVLLASCVLGMFWKHRPRGWGGFSVWLVVVWMVAELYAPLRTHLEKLSTVYYWSTQGSNRSRAERIANAIRYHTQPGEAIFVVGFDPQIYAVANRPSASRYPGTLWAFQTPTAGQAIADQIMGDLQQNKPRVIVADQSEILKLVNPSANGNQRPVFNGLDRLLRDYRPAATDLPQVWVLHDD